MMLRMIIPASKLLCNSLFSNAGLETRPSRPSSSQSDEGDANIVDKLLGDIRSGFTNKLGETDFSVTKIQKVKLDADSPLTPGVTTGSGDARTPSPVEEFQRSNSFRNRRGSLIGSRLQAIEEASPDGKARPNDLLKVDDEGHTRRVRSAEIESGSDLFDYLLKAEDLEKGTLAFERQGSLRRSRRRRMLGQGPAASERERAASPTVQSSANPADIPSPTHKSVAATILERRTMNHATSPPSSPQPRSISPLITSDHSRPTSSVSDDKNRWSTSSNETQAELHDEELAKEKARRRFEKRKQILADLENKPTDNKPTEAISEKPSLNNTAQVTSVKSEVVIPVSDTIPPVALKKKEDIGATPVLNTASKDTKDDDIDDTMVLPDYLKERRGSRSLLRSRSTLDPSELAKALRMVETESVIHHPIRSPILSPGGIRSPISPFEADSQAGFGGNFMNTNYDVTPANALERTRARLRKFSNNIDNNAVSAVIRKVEGNQMLGKDQNDNVGLVPKDPEPEPVVFRRTKSFTTRPRMKREYRHSVDRTNIDNVIQDIEKTGHEIQLIGSTQDLHVSSTKDTPLSSKPELERSNKGSWLNRRYRSHVDKSEVHQALAQLSSNSDDVPPTPPPRTTSKRGSVESINIPGSPDALSAVHRRGRISSDTSDTSTGLMSPVTRHRMTRDGSESITERALLDHSLGRWKSDIDASDVKQAIDNISNKPIVHVSSSASDLKAIDAPSSTGRAMRPVSVYDNVLHDIPERTSVRSNNLRNPEWGNPPDTTKSSPMLNNEPKLSPVTKRWGKVLNDDESKELNRSVSVTSVLERNDINNAQTGELNNNRSDIDTDLGYNSLDRSSKFRRSLRLGSLRANKSETSPESQTSVYNSTWRHNMESQELDNKVDQFRSALPDSEKLRRKEKFKALSARYENDDDSSWNTSVSKPIDNTYNTDPVVVGNLTTDISYQSRFDTSPLDQTGKAPLQYLFQASIQNWFHFPYYKRMMLEKT